jgi:hypothetical protein
MAVVIAVVVFAAAAVGVVMGLAVAGDPGVRTMDKMLPFKQDFAAYNAASVADIRAWVQQYGQNAQTIPDMPGVGAATPAERAAAADLLSRTEAGTAAFNDPAAAKAAGYDINPLISNVWRTYHGATGKAAMMHVQKAHRTGAVLDPSAPDDLMYDLQGDGSWKLTGVMYFADGAYPGPPPTPGGPITRWHYHPRMAMKHMMMHVFFVPGNDLSMAYMIDMNMDGM